MATGRAGDSFVLLPRILGCWGSFTRAFLLGRLVNFINGGRNSYDPVEILAKKLRKLNETNILVITILESQKLS